jgi:flagellar assembly protein FliH
MTVLSKVAESKESRTAYQRWELDSFDTPASGSAKGAVVLPTAAQLEQLRRQAQEEGYAKGYREGRDKVNAEAQRLQQIMLVLAQDLQRFDQDVADALLGLALTISKQVLRQAIKLKPEVILAAVNDVLGQLALSQQRARLVLHPEDAALVREKLGEQLKQSNWEIIESAEIARSGCRVEAPECEIDATLECRWQRVVNAMGSDNVWIE